MASNKENEEVKEMIQSLYRLANLPVWNGEVNERVAEVFGVMLSETKKCSDAFKLIPTPPGWKATIGWLVMQFGRGLFRHYSLKLSLTCARSVIYNWGTELEMAAKGIVSVRLPAWT